MKANTISPTVPANLNTNSKGESPDSRQDLNAKDDHEFVDTKACSIRQWGLHNPPNGTATLPVTAAVLMDSFTSIMITTYQ